MFGSKQIVILVVFSLLLSACATPTTSTPIVVTSTNIPIPTDIPTSTATAGDAFLKFPAVNCCSGRALEAGRYEIPPWLGIPLTVNVGEGWKALNEEAALFFAIARGKNVQNNPSQMIVFFNATGQGSAESLLNAVRQSPEMVPTTEIVPVTISGFPALQLDSTVKSNPDYTGNAEEDIPPGVQFLPVFMKFFALGFMWTSSTPEARIRTIAVTIGEQTLLLYLESPPDEFDQFAVDAEPILYSLELIEQ